MNNEGREDDLRFSRTAQNVVFVLGYLTLLLVALYPASGPPNLRVAFLWGFYSIAMLGGPLAVASALAAFAYSRGVEHQGFNRRLALTAFVAAILGTVSATVWAILLVT